MHVSHELWIWGAEYFLSVLRCQNSDLSTNSKKSIWTSNNNQLLSKRQEITNTDNNAEKGEPLRTTGGNVNWRSHYRKCYGGSSKTYNYHMIQQTHFWVYRQRKWQTCTQPVLAAVLLKIANIWKQPKCLSMGE